MAHSRGNHVPHIFVDHVPGNSEQFCYAVGCSWMFFCISICRADENYEALKQLIANLMVLFSLTIAGIAAVILMWIFAM